MRDVMRQNKISKLLKLFSSEFREEVHTIVFEKNASPELKQVFHAKFMLYILLLQMLFLLKSRNKFPEKKSLFCLESISKMHFFPYIPHFITSKKVKASI